MKKFGLAVLGIIAAIVVLTNLGSLIGLAISATITFAGVHYYRKSDSTFLKLFWGFVLVMGLLTAVTNIPAFIGIVAMLGVYWVWRNWDGKKKETIITQSDDPFVNFERQWNEITK
ncbi:ABC transporter permease [Sporosarcina sp. Te-1]|uniref:lmo0954 family membrane protein n=1 Tax=Sporosarcina sp. Te-1 TaxID=2818390 RepID=UPI001A9E07F7|nr:ABC transporter permease [Sporosarcina sp. Te-1]QTD40441.1 ABC transporter permease [Sporosarcina sp. Te-1]